MEGYAEAAGEEEKRVGDMLQYEDFGDASDALIDTT